MRPGNERSVQARISSGDCARSSAAADWRPAGVRIVDERTRVSVVIASGRRRRLQGGDEATPAQGVEHLLDTSAIVSRSVFTSTSGAVGGSYGSDTPVNAVIVPASALPYSPFTSRRMHVSSEAFTYTSMNASPISRRASSRAAR